METERNRVGFVINRRLGGPARDLSSVRVYHTGQGRACVAGVSGCRSISIVVYITENNHGCSMEGEIEAKEQAKNRREFDGARKMPQF